MRDLKIDVVPVTKPELQLALQLIEHIAEQAFDPTQFVDEEKQRILAAVEKKIAGQEIIAPQHVEAARAEVVDLMAALRASLREADKATSGRQVSAQTTGAPCSESRRFVQRSRSRAGAEESWHEKGSVARKTSVLRPNAVNRFARKLSAFRTWR